MLKISLDATALLKIIVRIIYCIQDLTILGKHVHNSANNIYYNVA